MSYYSRDISQLKFCCYLGVMLLKLLIRICLQQYPLIKEFYLFHDYIWIFDLALKEYNLFVQRKYTAYFKITEH